MANGTGWTTGDKVGLAANVGSAIFGGIGASKAQKSNDKTAAAQQVIAALRNRAAAMAEQQALQQRQAEQYANMNPLGAEQQYIQRQKVLQAILPTLGTQIKAGDPSVAAAQGDAGAQVRALASNAGLAKTFSDDAIQRAIYDRRNATTAVDPTIQRMNLGDYGFADNGFQAENDALRTAILGRNQASRDAIMGDVNAEVSKAQQMEQQVANQKGTPWWRKILGPVAGVATGLIPGVGPMLAPIVGGAVGGVSDGARGAALGAGAGYGTEAIQSRSWNPYSLPQSGAGSNNQMTEASLPAGMWGSNRVSLGPSVDEMDQWSQSQSNLGPLAGIDSIETAITGLPARRRAPRRMFGAGTTNARSSGGASGSWGPSGPAPMPLVQMGLGGTQDVNRLMETVGSQYNQQGRLDTAAAIAGAITGSMGAPRMGFPGGRTGRPQLPGGSSSAGAFPPQGNPNMLPPGPPMPMGRGGTVTTPPVGLGRGATGIGGTQPQEMEVARLMQQLSKMKPGPQADAILQQMQSPLRQIPGATTGQLSPEIQALISKLRAVMGAR